MSLKPGDMNCRIAISYVQSGRGPLGEPLPEKQVESGKAWAKRELVSGRKVRTLDQQQVVETCLFTVYPGVLVDIDWKITTKIWFIPSGISTAKQTGSLSRGG